MPWYELIFESLFCSAFFEAGQVCFCHMVSFYMVNILYRMRVWLAGFAFKSMERCCCCRQSRFMKC